MAGDLEDFLRRAAARRQQKAMQEKQKAQQQQPRVPPQYSDSRTERVARPVEPVDEVLVANVVEDSNDSYAAQLQRIEDTKRAAAAAQREAKRTAGETAQRASRKSGRSTVVTETGSPTSDLINMLKRPGGVRKAILLREILDRPIHRW